MASDIKNEYRNARRTLWDFVACKRDHWKGLGRYYHQRLQEIYRFVIPEGMRVLEIGCAEGNLLAALKPSMGVGIDFSPEMIRRAKQMHPDLEFALVDAHDLNYQEDFDFIILSDLVNDLWDIQAVLEQVARHVTPRSRIVRCPPLGA